jgi:hypothetical protein
MPERPDAPGGDHRNFGGSRATLDSPATSGPARVPSTAISVTIEGVDTRHRRTRRRGRRPLRHVRSVQPCVATSPLRASSPTATGCSAATSLRTRSGCLERGRADHDPTTPRCRRAHRRRRRFGRLPPTCTGTGDAAQMAAITLRFVGLAGAGGVEVDHVEPLGAPAASKASGLRRRDRRRRRSRARSRPAEPHTLPAPQVDGRVQVHHRLRSSTRCGRATTRSTAS